jgi:putative transposase
VISDAHEVFKAAVAKVLHATTCQRCRIPRSEKLLAHARPSQRAMVAAAMRTVFTQENHNAARRQWRRWSTACASASSGSPGPWTRPR